MGNRNYRESLIEVEKALEELRERSKKIPIIVEGERDKRSLRSLEVMGKVIVLNKGMAIPDFCDRVLSKYEEIIILTDWDKKGGKLCSLITKCLSGRTRCNIEIRKRFAKNTNVKNVEELVSWLLIARKKLGLEQ